MDFCQQEHYEKKHLSHRCGVDWAIKNINFEGINCLGAKEAVVIEPLKDMPETITDIHIKASSFVTSGENRVECDCLTSEQTTYEIL